LFFFEESGAIGVACCPCGARRRRHQLGEHEVPAKNRSSLGKKKKQSPTFLTPSLRRFVLFGLNSPCAAAAVRGNRMAPKKSASSSTEAAAVAGGAPATLSTSLPSAQSTATTSAADASTSSAPNSP